MSKEPLAFGCTCGALAGQVAAEGVKSGTHLVCHCVDCRTAHLSLGQPDPRPDGIALFQTTPDMITITQGAEHLRLMQLSPNGLYRWYAGCCNTSLGNSLRKPTLPFFGLVVDRIAQPERIGRVRCQGFLPSEAGKGPRHKGAFYMATRFASRLIGTRLSGKWRSTPFFDVETGKPVISPVLIDPAERTRLSQA